MGRVAESPAHVVFDAPHGRPHAVPHVLRQVPRVLVGAAQRRRQGKAWRHGNAHVGHFLQAQALAAEKLLVGVRDGSRRPPKAHDAVHRRRRGDRRGLLERQQQQRRGRRRPGDGAGARGDRVGMGGPKTHRSEKE